MKKYIFLCLVLFLARRSYSTQIAADGTVAKYMFDGNPVWTEQDKNEMIANGTTATRTITSADFSSIFPTKSQIVATTTTFKISWDGKRFGVPLKGFDMQKLRKEIEK
jgi:hypothetical protein